MGFLDRFTKKTVGVDVLLEDIHEFVYTVSSSALPCHFLRFRFVCDGNTYVFQSERKEGNHWPLSETDRVFYKECELSFSQWMMIMETLKNGVVKKRTERIETGSSGPWMFLYWKGDSGIQEFSFSSFSARCTFEKLCAELTSDLT